MFIIFRLRVVLQVYYKAFQGHATLVHSASYSNVSSSLNKKRHVTRKTPFQTVSINKYVSRRHTNESD